MKTYVNSDGIIHIRCRSSETKPVGVVNAFDNNTKGAYNVNIVAGSELIETDTSKIFIYDSIDGWREL